MFSTGTIVQSTRDPKINGTVVGYGLLQWPINIDGSIGDVMPKTVYLVQVLQGSSGLGPACATLDAQYTIEMG